MSIEWNGVPRPEWATGCEHCKYGIVSAPPVNSTDLPLVWQRAIAMRFGLVVFCECRAGQAQQFYLESVLVQIPERIQVTRRKSDNMPAWVGDAPQEYVPGSWWQQVRDVADASPTTHDESIEQEDVQDAARSRSES